MRSGDLHRRTRAEVDRGKKRVVRVKIQAVNKILRDVIDAFPLLGSPLEVERNV